MNKIFYLGPKGSYSYQAAGKLFQNANLEGCENFGDIVKNTLADKESAGVLPIENSITSSVHENIDNLFNEKLTVIGEAFLKIRLHLIGLKGAAASDIKKVYSHPQALLQCKKFISENNLNSEETSSTEAAKKIILSGGDNRAAAIGSNVLGDNDGLEILKSDIGDERFNLTRFLFISAKGEQENMANFNKASIVFSLSHKPGALAKLLTDLGKENFNLTKIESRPIPSTDWEYRFWVDIEKEGVENLNKNILNDILKANTQNFKIVGIYPAGKIYE